MPKKTNQGLSEDAKTLITVLLLLFAYPAGVIMMFVWMKWPMWVKILILLPLLFVIFMLTVAFPLIFGAAMNRTIQQQTQERARSPYTINSVQHYNTPAKGY